jgi:hypothetical protein
MNKEEPRARRGRRGKKTAQSKARRGAQGFVAGAGALLEGGGVVGVAAGGGVGLGLGAVEGVLSEVVVVGVEPLLANSSQAPTASRATTSRTGTRLQLPSSPRGMRSQSVFGAGSWGR